LPSAQGDADNRAIKGGPMKSFCRLSVFAAALTVSASAFAAKTYQVTGPIVDMSDKTITIEKAKGEKWEISRDANIKVSGGELKKGAKATVYYTMAADSVEVKGDKAAAKAEKKK
jgi:hypothetical protein